MAAGDIAESADLIAADWVNEFNGGGLSTVSGWLDLLPYETVSQDPRLSVARAWIALNVGQLDDAAEWIEAVEAGPAQTPQMTAASALKSSSCARFTRSRPATSPRRSETARRAITLDFGDAPLGRSGAHCVYGSALYFSGSTHEAQAAFRRAVQVAEKVGDRRARIYALGYLAMISAEHGQPADAEHQIRRASGSGRDLAEAEHFVDVMVSLAAADHPRHAWRRRLLRCPPPTWPSCRPAKVEQSSRWPRRCWPERRSSSTSATTRPRRPASKRPAVGARLRGCRHRCRRCSPRPSGAWASR